MIIFVPSNLRCMGKLELIMETEQVSIYSPKYDGESKSEFAKFLSSNCSHTHPQLKAFFDAILSAIEKIQECGARENLFRPEGGRVKALPMFYTYRRVNKSVGKIRLYCLCLSERVLIIGNGGVTTAARYDDDSVHLAYVEDLRAIFRQIRKIVRQAKTDYDDFDALKRIIESITL